MSVNKKIVTDNKVSRMIYYECDFEKMEERISRDDGDDLDIEQPSNTLGSFVCKLLSIDYECFSDELSTILDSSFMMGKSFPEVEVQRILSETFQEPGLQTLEILARIMKNIYNTKERKLFVKEYGSSRNAFFIEAYNRFKEIVVLQAYLEESENNSDMVSAISFERFINGFFGTKINRNEIGCSLSEYSPEIDISPGCNVREIVKDVFSNLVQFNDNYSVFVIDGFLKDFLISSVYYFLLNGFCFKRCKNCGKFFVPLSRSDEMYCNNVSPQDKKRTCKEYGSQKLWYDRLKDDEAAKLSRNIYSAKQMLVKRNPDILEYKKMFEYFKAERKKWEAWVKSGVKGKDEYISWLNEMKAKKTL